MHSTNALRTTPTSSVLVVSYPTTPETTFDWDYYLDSHLPLVLRLLRPLGLTTLSMDRATSDTDHFAAAHLQFGSLPELEKAIETAGHELDSDVAKFYNGAPKIRVRTRIHVTEEGTH